MTRAPFFLLDVSTPNSNFEPCALSASISIHGAVALYQLKYTYQSDQPCDALIRWISSPQEVLASFVVSQGERRVMLVSRADAEVPEEEMPQGLVGFTFARASVGSFCVELTIASQLRFDGSCALIALPGAGSSVAQCDLLVSLEGPLCQYKAPPEWERSESSGVVVLRSTSVDLLSRGVLSLSTDEVRPIITASLYKEQPIFLFTLPAPQLSPLPRRLTILLDCSGSMLGARFESSKRMLLLLLRALSPDDQFCIKTFGDKPIETQFYTPSDATIAKVTQLFSRLRAKGTEGFFALLRDVLAAPPEDDLPHHVVLITDVESVEDRALLSEVSQASEHLRLHCISVGPNADHLFLKMLSDAGRGYALHVDRARSLDAAGSELLVFCSSVVTSMSVGEVASLAPLKDVIAESSYSFGVSTSQSSVTLSGRASAGAWSTSLALFKPTSQCAALDLLWEKQRFLSDPMREKTQALFVSPWTSLYKREAGQDMKLVPRARRKNAISLHMPLLSRARPIFLGITPTYRLPEVIQRLPTVSDPLGMPKDFTSTRRYAIEPSSGQIPAALVAPSRSENEFPQFLMRSNDSQIAFTRNKIISGLSTQDRIDSSLYFLIRNQRANGSFHDDPSLTLTVKSALETVEIPSAACRLAIQRASSYLQQTKGAELLPCLVSREQLFDYQRLVGEQRGAVLNLGDPILMTAFLLRELSSRD